MPLENPFTARKRREALEREKQAIYQQQQRLKALQTAGTQNTARSTANASVRTAGTGPTAIRHSANGSINAKPVNVLQLLTNGQDLLNRLRQLPASDLEAFPLLNEAQRIVQRLREGVGKMAPAEQEVWQFQVKELEDEIGSQTDRIMAGAAAALPPPTENPKYASRSSSHSGAVTGSKKHLVSSPPPLSTPSRPILRQPAPHTAPRLGASNSTTTSTKGLAVKASRRGYQAPPLEPLSPQIKPQAQTFTPEAQSSAISNRTGLFGQQAGQSGETSVTLQSWKRHATADQSNSVAMKVPSLGSAVQGQPPSDVAVHANALANAFAAAGRHSQVASSIQPQQMELGKQPRMSEDMFRGLHVGDLESRSSNNRAAAAAALAALQKFDQSTAITTAASSAVPNVKQSQLPVMGLSNSIMIQSAIQQAQQMHAGITSDEPAAMGAQADAAAASSNVLGSRRASSATGVAATISRISTATPFADHRGPASLQLGKATSLAGKGLTASLVRRLSSTPSSLSGAGGVAWSADMTAAAAAAYAAQAGITLEELGSKKVIKKKTRGVKVGYGVDEEGDNGSDVSLVIPGQPMPGPQYIAAHLVQPETFTAQAASQAPVQGPVQQGEFTERVQELISQRQAYLAAQAPSSAPAMTSVTADRAPYDGYASRYAPVQGGVVTATVNGNHNAEVINSAVSPISQQVPVVPVSNQQSVTELPAFKVSSTDPIKDLQNYLAGLTGSLASCQQAATVAAAHLVQSLAASAQQALAEQLAANEKCRAALQQLSNLDENVSQLEARQAAAAQAEDFGTAAALDVQIKEVAAQKDRLQRGLTTVRSHASQLVDQHTTSTAMQADACNMVAAYLTQLHSNHAKLIQQLEESAEEEAKAAEAAHAHAKSSIEESRMALASRKVQLAAALEEVDSQVHKATSSIQRDRSALATQHSELISDIQNLRALLAEKEAALAAVTRAMHEAEQRIQMSSSQLLAAKSTLAAQQDALSNQEKAIEDKANEAQAAHKAVLDRLSAQAAQRSTFAGQGTSLNEAASKLRSMADRILLRVAADKEASAVREQLWSAATASQQAFDAHAQQLSACEKQLSEQSAATAQLSAQIQMLKQASNQALLNMPALEAAKNMAVAQKDYQEAARLSALIKDANQQSEAMQQQEGAAQQQLSQLSISMQQLQSKLASLRSEEPQLRRNAALHRYRFLTGSARSRVKQVEASAGLPAVQAALQAEAELERTEAQQLAATWGFEDVDTGAVNPDSNLQSEINSNLSRVQPKSSSSSPAPGPPAEQIVVLTTGNQTTLATRQTDVTPAPLASHTQSHANTNQLQQQQQNHAAPHQPPAALGLQNNSGLSHMQHQSASGVARQPALQLGIHRVVQSAGPGSPAAYSSNIEAGKRFSLGAMGQSYPSGSSNQPGGMQRQPETTGNAVTAASGNDGDSQQTEHVMQAEQVAGDYVSQGSGIMNASADEVHRTLESKPSTRLFDGLHMEGHVEEGGRDTQKLGQVSASLQHNNDGYDSDDIR